MPLFHKADNARLLDELLDREYAALIHGRLDELAEILPRKEHLLEEVAKTRPAPEAIAAMRDKAERNIGLLESAGRGIRAAIDRIEALTKARSELVTYDSKGRVSGRGGGHPTLHRRA